MLNKNKEFNVDSGSWPKDSNYEFLLGQLQVLNGYKKVNPNSFKEIIKAYDDENKVTPFMRIFHSNKRVDSKLTANIPLESILTSIRECHHIDNLLKDYQNGLGGKERSIMVGLFSQLKTREDANFGYNLLLELFSNIKGYNKEITEQKLAYSKYYFPINCAHFGKCDLCEKKGIVSPIELINGIEIVDKPSFSLNTVDELIFERIKKSQLKYSVINDEVPLYPQLIKLEKLDLITISEKIDLIFKGELPDMSETYRFERNEITKTRLLYNLDATNNVISTYFLFILNNIFNSLISSNSYGFRLANSFYQNNIFTNWFINWTTFSKKK